MGPHQRGGPDQNWQANPHWVEVKLRPEGGPVENYVTPRGNNRTVEIGAFLSPDERQEMYYCFIGGLDRSEVGYADFAGFQGSSLDDRF